MEVTCTGHGIQVTDEMRESAIRKVSRLERMEGRATRLEVQIIVEKNPRLAHLKRLEATLHTPRKTYRAHGQDAEFENALDEVVGRLERQVRDHHEKRRTKVLSSARSVPKGNPLESAHERDAPADTSE
jgi:putative sigma-54 modulation protein